MADNYLTPEEQLANSRRISGDNADIAVKVMGMLAECQQKLSDLVEAADRLQITGHRGGHKSTWIKAVDAGRELIEKQKHEKPY